MTFGTFITTVMDMLSSALVAPYCLLLLVCLLNLLYIHDKLPTKWAFENVHEMLLKSKDHATEFVSKRFLLVSAINAPFMVYLGVAHSDDMLAPVILTIFLTATSAFGALYLSSRNKLKMA